MKAESVVRQGFYRAASLSDAVRAAAVGSAPWDDPFLSKLAAATQAHMDAQATANLVAAKKQQDEHVRSLDARARREPLARDSRVRRDRSRERPARRQAGEDDSDSWTPGRRRGVSPAKGAGKSAGGKGGKGGEKGGAQSLLMDSALSPFKGGSGCMDFHVRGECKAGASCKKTHSCPMKSCKGAEHCFKLTHPGLSWSGVPKTEGSK